MEQKGEYAVQQEMEYVYQVYKEKNFTRAAEKLYITQPALSMAVQKAEEKLGMPIFDRSERPLALTDAGRAYLDHILQIRELETELDQQIRDIREVNTGKITLGGSHYLNAYILPDILAGFSARYPGVEIDLKEASSAVLSERLREKELDLTFNCSPEFIRDFERFPAFRDHILLALPPALDPCYDPDALLSPEMVQKGRHLEADCPALPLTFFRSIPFILLSEGNNLYERSVAMFREAEFAPRVNLRLSQLVTSYHLSEAGMGAVFVSDRLVCASGKDLHYYKIDSALTQRQFYMLLPQRKYVSAAVRRFISYCREALE